MISSLNTIPAQAVDNVLGFLEIVRAAQDAETIAKTFAELRQAQEEVELAKALLAKIQATAQAKIDESESVRLDVQQAIEDAKRAEADVAAEYARLADARQALEDDQLRLKAEQAAHAADVEALAQRGRDHVAKVEADQRVIAVARVAVQAERGDVDRLATELEAREADLNKRLEALRALAGA